MKADGMKKNAEEYNGRQDVADLTITARGCFWKWTYYEFDTMDTD